ncbi:Respiratory supercomplex factor 1, mitochondrial [Fusarium keratoplasticum]|uniref:Respiratory supercomplex factor 1, mitochondrial n=1 Tax=Fusarium keratoplasticum TaxID=1328300 RepID=A0ACC0RIT2_9HYPO|nr:Respiratory supercomplex factor 1, mitochondrial [Fusarium keratoplasticum]KAI8684974.1 Respiratory supercomplex factor 1, mitochondrial [Fusarium keratoplasticum]KAI8689077.1 Respiratory supercomplex factor 1, mitochondrial [Fusarium keratoplasticum]
MADGPPSIPGPLPSSFDSDQDFYNERPMQKVFRKIKEEPLIPLGIGLTSLAFVNAYRALRRGDSKQANRMFRARVAAQGFTVIAMLAGSMYYQKDREKSKELRQLQEQRDAEEKRLKWIRELEARDDEEKAMKARLEQRRQLVQAQRAEEAEAAAAAAAATTTEEKPEATSGGTGGILGRIGLWPQGEKKEEEKKAAEELVEETASDKPGKKKNPKSSLGDLGEIISSQKKD